MDGVRRLMAPTVSLGVSGATGRTTAPGCGERSESRPSETARSTADGTTTSSLVATTSCRSFVRAGFTGLSASLVFAVLTGGPVGGPQLTFA